MAGIQLIQTGGAGTLNAAGAQNPSPFVTVLTNILCQLSVVGTTPSSYTWTLGVPSNSKAELNTTSGSAPQFTPDKPGNYSVVLVDQAQTIYSLQLIVQQTAVTTAFGPLALVVAAPTAVTTPVSGQVLFCDMSNSGVLSMKSSNGQVSTLLQTFAVGGDVSGNLPNPVVTAVTGISNVIAVHGNQFLWDITKNPEIKQTDTTGENGRNLIIRAQSTNAPFFGGALELHSGSGVDSQGIKFFEGNTEIAQMFAEGGISPKLVLLSSASWLITTPSSILRLECQSQMIQDALSFVIRAWETTVNVGNSRIMNFRYNGLRIGDLTAATDRLEIVGGNIAFDVASTNPKIYIPNNTTLNATATSLTLQAPNATNGNATGGTLKLQAGNGAGLGLPGDVQLAVGAALGAARGKFSFLDGVTEFFKIVNTGAATLTAVSMDFNLVTTGFCTIDVTSGLLVRNNSGLVTMLGVTPTSVTIAISGTNRIQANTTGLGFFNVTPVARPAAYTISNHTSDRTLNETADTLVQVANVLGTVITDLQSLGLLQ